MGLDWHCSECTYLHKFPGTRCAMCGALRTSHQQIVDFVTGNTNTATSKSQDKSKDNGINNIARPDPSNGPIDVPPARPRINPYATKKSSVDKTLQKTVTFGQSGHATAQDNRVATNTNSTFNHYNNPSNDTNHKKTVSYTNTVSSSRFQAQRKNPYNNKLQTSSPKLNVVNSKSKTNMTCQSNDIVESSGVSTNGTTCSNYPSHDKQFEIHNATSNNHHAFNPNNSSSMLKHRHNPYARKRTTTMTSKITEISSQSNQNITLPLHLANQQNQNQPYNNNRSNPMSPTSDTSYLHRIIANQSLSNHQQGNSPIHENQNNKINQSTKINNEFNKYLPEPPDNPFKLAARASLPKIKQGYVPGPIPICEKSSHEWIYPKSDKYPERDYQLKISHSAINQNTLVSLPTGLGKTLIAAVVMYNFYRWFPSGKVVFLAPTRPLVTQQIEACYNIMGIPEEDTAEMSGKIFKATRQELWGLRRVFFCTPQTLQKDIAEGRCDAKKIVCVIFDEAHKATGNYAYTKVMEQVENSGAKFRVVGLSATPGTTNTHVKGVIKALRISKIEARLDEDIDVKKYVHTRHVEKIIVPISEKVTAVESRFEDIIKPLMMLLRRENALPSYIQSDSKLKPFAIRKAMMDYNERMKNKSLNDKFIALETFISARIALRESGIFIAESRLKKYANEHQSPFTRTIINGEKFKAVMETIAAITNTSKDNSSALILTNPKLQKLNEVLIEFFNRSRASGESTRAIVFTQWRDSVEEIVKVLSNSKPLVLPAKFVGQSVSGKDTNKTTGMNQKEQQKVLREFKKGIYNALVCTAIGEEGLDIGEVDLIVNYDCLSSPIRMVQRVGRTGRKRDGRVVSLVSEGGEGEKLERSEAKTKSLWIMLKKASTTFKMIRDVPLLPVYPCLKRLSMQTKSSYHYSQVGGHTPSNRRKYYTRRVPQNETACWKLNESTNRERKRLFGEINSFSDCSNKWNKKYIRAWQSSYRRSMDKKRKRYEKATFSLVLKNFLNEVSKENSFPTSNSDYVYMSKKLNFQSEISTTLTLSRDGSPVQDEVRVAAAYNSSGSDSSVLQDYLVVTTRKDYVKGLDGIFHSRLDLGSDKNGINSLFEKSLPLIFSNIDCNIVPPEIDEETNINGDENLTVLTSESKVDIDYQTFRESEEGSEDDEALCAFFDRQKQLQLPPNRPSRDLISNNKAFLDKKCIKSIFGDLSTSNKESLGSKGDDKPDKGHTPKDNSEIGLENDSVLFTCRSQKYHNEEYMQPEIQDPRLYREEKNAPEKDGIPGHTISELEEAEPGIPAASQADIEDDEDLSCFQLPTPEDSSSSDDDSENNQTAPLTSANQQLQLNQFPTQSTALDFENSCEDKSTKDDFDFENIKYSSTVKKIINSSGTDSTGRPFLDQNFGSSLRTTSRNDNKFEDNNENSCNKHNTTSVGSHLGSFSKKSESEDADSIENIRVMLPTQDSSSEEEMSAASTVSISSDNQLIKKVAENNKLSNLSQMVLLDKMKIVTEKTAVTCKTNNNSTITTDTYRSFDYEDNSPVKCGKKSTKIDCAFRPSQPTNFEKSSPQFKQTLDRTVDFSNHKTNILSNSGSAVTTEVQKKCERFDLLSKDSNKAENIFQSNNRTSLDVEDDSPIRLSRRSKKTRNVLFSQSPEQQLTSRCPNLPSSSHSCRKQKNKFTLDRQVDTHNVSKNQIIVDDEKAYEDDLHDTPFKDKESLSRDSFDSSREINKNNFIMENYNKRENADGMQSDDCHIVNKSKPTRKLLKQDLNRKYKTKNISAFFDLEAEICSEDDIEGDVEELSNIRDIEKERLSLDSFINDSSQLGYTQDPLDLVDTPGSIVQDGNNAYATTRAFYQNFNNSKKNESPFKTPILNRRMYRDRHKKPNNVFCEDEWARETPQSTSSSERGLGNMNFIRSVIDHHRKGGNLHEVEKEYEKIRLQNLSNESNQSYSQDDVLHRPIVFNFKDKNESSQGHSNDSATIKSKDRMQVNKNFDKTTSEMLEKVASISVSLNSTSTNSKPNLTKQANKSSSSKSINRENLTIEQRARMERNRQEALRKRAARLEAVGGPDK